VGDYTGGGFALWRATPEEAAAIAQELEAIGVIDTEHGGSSSPLAVGEWSEYGDIRCGSVEDLAPGMAEAAPGAVWQFYEEPKYEWLGTCAWYHPDHGLYVAECGINGTPVVSYAAIVATGILTDPTIEGLREAQARLRALLGAAHHAAFDELNPLKNPPG
jgi:hypothetical protein